MEFVCINLFVFFLAIRSSYNDIDFLIKLMVNVSSLYFYHLLYTQTRSLDSREVCSYSIKFYIYLYAYTYVCIYMNMYVYKRNNVLKGTTKTKLY